MLKPFQTFRNARLAASDGDIGHVKDFYFDDEHWTVRYFVVNTGSWLLGREVLVSPQSLGAFDADHGTIAIHLTREQVRESPALDSKIRPSRQHEEALHQYYGWNPYWLTPDGGAGMMLPPTALVPPPAFAPPPELSPEGPASESGEEVAGEPHLRSASELMSGYTIHAPDGDIGRVDDLILNDEGWRVLYLDIHTGAWFHGKDALLPVSVVERISFADAEAFVTVPRNVIKDAPSYDAAGPITPEYEQQLAAHYRGNANPR